MASVLARMFGPAPVAAPVAPTPGNIPATQATTGATVATSATAPNGVLPANTTAAAAAQSPMAEFADLFKVDPNAPKPTNGQPLFNVDQAKMLETARKQAFASAATPEQLAAVAAGGQGAVVAMQEMMTDLYQQAIAHSAFNATKLIDHGLERSNFAKADALPDLIRAHSTDATLRESNPLYTNPAVQPLLDMAKQQMLVKYPTATPSEIAALANNYITQFAEAVKGPQVAAAAATKAPKDVDWSNFG